MIWTAFIAAVGMFWGLIVAGLVYRFETERDPVPYFFATIVSTFLGSGSLLWMLQ